MTSEERTEERHAETAVAFRKVRRGERAKRWAVVVGFVLAAAIIALQLILMLQVRSQGSAIREQQQATAPKVDRTARILAILQGCTVPSGACTKRNEAATAAAIGSINEVQFYSLACFASLPADLSPQGNLAYLRTCVTGFLKESN